VPSSYDAAPTSLGAVDDISPPDRLRLRQLRPIKCLDDLQAAARDAAWIKEIPRGDASEDLQEMARSAGLIDTFGDNIVAAYMAAGFEQGDKDIADGADGAETSTAQNHNGNDYLDEASSKTG
jgi:hypothetical protein